MNPRFVAWRTASLRLQTMKVSLRMATQFAAASGCNSVMKTNKFKLKLFVAIVLLTSCGSAKSPVQIQIETTSTQVVLVLPSAQIFSLVDSYIASTLGRRPELFSSKNSDQLKECVQREALNLGSSILQTFTNQDFANSVVMQQIQQNLERLATQCAMK